MELIRNPRRHLQPPSAAVLGNFDGVHVGHQMIAKTIKTLAAKFNLPSAVITFEPQTQEYFSPHAAPARLTCLREKYQVFQALGIDRLICLPFGDAIANLSAREFVKKLLIDILNIQHLVIGDDFRFGKARQGDGALLRQMAQEFGYQLVEVASCMIAGQRVSSTRIRQMLANGDLRHAAQLLGRAYSISGRVIHGDKRGRRLGFPTANIAPRRRRSAVDGVYVTRSALHRADTTVYYPSVTSVGYRPMFASRGLRFETHLIDFDESIYAHPLRVDFLKKIRPETHYAGLTELRQAIADDVAVARAYFARHDLMDAP